MKTIFSATLLTVAACSAQAQEVATLDQAFRLRFDSWKVGTAGTGQPQAMATTQATYNLVAGMPVLSYDLGALAVTSTVDYLRQTEEGASATALNLSSYGFQANLFPYRNFHLALNYQHSQSPAALGPNRVEGDAYGVAWIYQGPKVQDVRLTFRHGTTSSGANSEGWSSWTLAGRQDTKGTAVRYEVQHLEMSSHGWGGDYQSTLVMGNTDSHLSKDWSFRTNFLGQEQASGQSLSTNAALIGRLGNVISMSSLSVEGAKSAGSWREGIQVAQTLSKAVSKWTTYGSVVYGSNPGQGGRTSTESLVLGEVVAISPQWRVSGDISQSAFSSGGTTSAFGETRSFTVHAGVSRGGDIPEVLQHSLFFLSDLRFQRQILEDYPPDYVPSELAQQLLQRRLKHNGALGFSLDLTHSKAGGGRTADGFHASGDLGVNSGFRMSLAADASTDRGYTQPGLRVQDQMLMANFCQAFGTSYLNGSVGMSRANMDGIPGQDVSPTGALSAALAPHSATSSRFTALSFNSQFRTIPYQLLMNRFRDGLGVTTNSLGANANLNFRQLTLRISVDTNHRSDGLRYRRVNIELMRLFDTMPLWGR